MNDTKRRRYGWIVEEQRLVGLPLTFIVILLFMGLVFHTLARRVPPEIPSEAQNWRIKPACLENDVICLIHEYSAKYGIETDIALRVAECESQYGKYEHNFTGSTAKGVYQFIDSTWEYTGGGDVLDPRQNIERFAMFYNKHPGWWSCR